ncbi:MAG: hypothetical protein QXX17_05150 [Conexivisphaerales archaeon]
MIERCIDVKPQKKDREIIAVDKTKIKVNGMHLFICNAIDAKTKELIAYRVLRTDKKHNRCYNTAKSNAIMLLQQ